MPAKLAMLAFLKIRLPRIAAIAAMVAKPGLQAFEGVKGGRLIF